MVCQVRWYVGIKSPVFVCSISMLVFSDKMPDISCHVNNLTEDHVLSAQWLTAAVLKG